MKDYKLPLVGLIVLLLIVFLGLLIWLYYHNQKNVNPLPIVADATTATDNNEPVDTDDATVSTLYIQADDSLQLPLDDVIVRFERRYPKMQVLARYVPTPSLISLPNISNYNHVRTAFLLSTDMVIADDKLQQSQLDTLQDVLNEAQNKRNTNKEEADAILLESRDNTDSEAENTDQSMSTDQKAAASGSNEARSLTSFSYALKDQQAVEGVILTHNPIAVSFRNFLLSSTGQDILNRYEYRNIDGYKKNIDDLFNPTTNGQSADDDESDVEVADALSNGN